MSFLEDNGYLVFDGVKSSDYGVWINGRDTYNAPARRYKEYIVPGRNGTLTIDEGAFDEQEVTYPAFIVDDFNTNVEAFRNELMSRNGYVRMTDSYHPYEYYMAKYMSGLDADVMPWGRAGRFDLKFKRDPRRFLLSGEEPATYPTENLLPDSYNGSTTGSSIQWREIGDGTVAASGQADPGVNNTFFLVQNDSLPLLPGETYKLTGGRNASLKIVVKQYIGSVYTVRSDEGSGITFTHVDGATYDCYILVGPGVRLAYEVIFKPAIRINIDYTVNNPTLFPSKPLIRVTGSGTVGIGDETITIASGYDYVDIDSEIQNCYCGNQNANAAVTFSNREFPELQPGLNGVTFGTGIESVQITPRWYRI